MNASARILLFNAYKARVMPKLALPLSQVNDLSVIRDANGVCVSVHEHATAFMQAMNLVHELAQSDVPHFTAEALEIIAKVQQ